MKRLLISLILALTTLIPLSAANKITSIMPLMWDGGNHCTTFSINETKGLWSTAYHCVAEDQAFMIGGEPVTVYMLNKKEDSAVLAGPHAPALRLSPTSPKGGDEITVKGFPFGIEGLSSPVITTHGAYLDTFTDSDGTWNMYDITAAPGNSGSPVMTKRGVIGSLNFGWNTAGRLGGGTRWVVMDALRQLGVWE